jgi:DNA-directed RNA polymerase specialized sigma24 family protein
VAPRKRTLGRPVEDSEDRSANPADKIANLLAIIVAKLYETDEAAIKLAAAGFSTREIAALLEVNSKFVHNAKFRRKSRPQNARRAPKRGPK